MPTCCIGTGWKLVEADFFEGIDLDMVPKGERVSLVPFLSFIPFSQHFRRFYQPHSSYTECTKLINLPQIGTNRAPFCLLGGVRFNQMGIRSDALH